MRQTQEKLLEGVPWEIAYEHLMKASKRSPFYRQYFQENNIDLTLFQGYNDFYQYIPCIDKLTIIEMQQKEPPFGALFCGDNEQLTRFFFSPGPYVMPFTLADYEGIISSWMRGFTAAGVKQGDRVDATGNYHMVLGGMVMDEAFRRLGCAVLPGGVGNTRSHVEAIKQIGINVLFSFPTFLEHLAQQAIEMGIQPKDLGVELALIGGEQFSQETIHRLEETFLMTVREMYATADTGILCVACNAYDGMHIQDGYVVEVIDPVTLQRVPPEQGGELVVTHFFRPDMPIFRYRTGDMVDSILFEACSCGRNSPRIHKVIGRAGMIPRVKGMFVIPHELEKMVKQFPEIQKYQLRITRPVVQDIVTLRIEVEETKQSEKLKERVMRAFRESIRIGAEVQYVSPGALQGESTIDDQRGYTQTSSSVG